MSRFRVIAEAFGRAWMFTLDSARVVEQEEPTGPTFDMAPVDPHTVAGCHVEHGPGADSYSSDVVAAKAPKPPFGFRHGSQDAS